MKLVAATCSDQFADQLVLYEPPDLGLPAGLLASASLVQVYRGKVYIPVIKIGDSDILLFPRTYIGCLSSVHMVNLPPGTTDAG